METAATTMLVEIEVEINATKDRVWEALTKEMGAWWREDFFITKQPAKMTVEPWAGGRMYEESESGESMLWSTVNWVIPGEKLCFISQIWPPFGGPAISMITIDIEQEGNTTKLKLYDNLLGKVDEKMRESLDAGWKLLFADGLKNYVESA